MSGDILAVLPMWPTIPRELVSLEGAENKLIANSYRLVPKPVFHFFVLSETKPYLSGDSAARAYGKEQGVTMGYMRNSTTLRLTAKPQRSLGSRSRTREHGPLAAQEEVEQVRAQARSKSSLSGASALAHVSTQILASATPHQPLMNIG